MTDLYAGVGTTVQCAGVPIAALTRDAAADLVIQAALDLSDLRATRGMDVHLCNAYTLALADDQEPLHALLRSASLNLPDGMSVVWANRLRHPDAPRERVYGPDLFLDVLDRGRPEELRHYLLGSTPEVVDALQTQLHTRFPGVQIVGVESPPFRPLTAEELVAQDDRIRASRAQVVWVGLGTPKQDWETARLAKNVPALSIAVGAAFDFVAGAKTQAPEWMQHNGLEWAYRLASEPRRLWKRYLFGNARFVWAAARPRD